MHNDPPRVPRGPLEGEVEYRLYFFNGGRHIEKSHEFFAKDDSAAIRISEGWREGRRMELWQRDRRVKQWE